MKRCGISQPRGWCTIASVHIHDSLFICPMSMHLRNLCTWLFLHLPVQMDRQLSLLDGGDTIGLRSLSCLVDAHLPDTPSFFFSQNNNKPQKSSKTGSCRSNHCGMKCVLSRTKIYEFIVIYKIVCRDSVSGHPRQVDKPGKRSPPDWGRGAVLKPCNKFGPKTGSLEQTHCDTECGENGVNFGQYILGLVQPQTLYILWAVILEPA